MSDAEIMQCDVLIVGAGPAGLSAAIHLMQQAAEQGKEAPNVMLLEKGAEVGAHIMSGCVLEPRALNELIPDWKERGAPLEVEAGKDSFKLLTTKGSFKLPTPPQMKNHGNYIISLSNFVRWLGEQAEALGVQIFPGFPAAEAIIEDGTIKGVKTGAFGIGKDGQPKDSFQPPMEIRADVTMFAEGCRGSLSQQLMSEFNLRDEDKPQTYGIGIKELWEIKPENSKVGQIEHSIGWPLKTDTYGGSFMYHMNNNQLAVGFVIGLDYTNPYLDPFQEFQKFKTHPSVKGVFEGAKRLSYGARALNEGGFQSIPRLIMPGGLLLGCAAGFLNVPKIKGTHTAMKSGMLAAEAILDGDINSYSDKLEKSWVYDELHAVRNIRPSFQKGLWYGLGYSAIDTYLLRGKAPWTFGNHPDHTQVKPAKDCRKIEYPAPDGVLTFDRLSSVFLSNTNHEEDQPAHLTLKSEDVPTNLNLPIYDAIESRFCPAGVYEYVDDGKGDKRLQINAQNCVHCKTCDIKDPSQNIVWTTPEGGGGPVYSGM